jgi:hypothetical protein
VYIVAVSDVDDASAAGSVSGVATERGSVRGRDGESGGRGKAYLRRVGFVKV